MNWLYQGEELTELPPNVIGFVYVIHYYGGKHYVGKKLARSERKKKPLKGMRSNARRMVMTEHNWKDYEGSSKDIPDDARIHSKVILWLCTNKTTLTWMEVKEMVSRNVLTNNNYYNKNILGKFWDNCEQGVYYGATRVQRGLFDEITD